VIEVTNVWSILAVGTASAWLWHGRRFSYAFPVSEHNFIIGFGQGLRLKYTITWINVFPNCFILHILATLFSPLYGSSQNSSSSFEKSFIVIHIVLSHEAMFLFRATSVKSHNSMLSPVLFSGCLFIYCFTYKQISVHSLPGGLQIFLESRFVTVNIKMSCWIKHDISTEHGYGLYELTCCIRYLYRLKFVISSWTSGYNGYIALLRACLEGIIALTRPRSSCVQFVMAGLHSSLDPLY